MKRTTLVRRMLLGYIGLVLLPTILSGVWFISRINGDYVTARKKDIHAWAASGAGMIENTLHVFMENGQFIQNSNSLVSFISEGPYETIDQLELWFSDIQSIYRYLRYANPYVKKTVLYTDNSRILDLGGFVQTTEDMSSLMQRRDGWEIRDNGTSLVFSQRIYAEDYRKLIAVFEMECDAKLIWDIMGSDALVDGVYLRNDDAIYRVSREGLVLQEEREDYAAVARLSYLDMDICVNSSNFGRLIDSHFYTPLLLTLATSVACTVIYAIYVYRFSRRVQRMARHIASPDAMTPFEEEGSDELSMLSGAYNRMLMTNENMLRQVEIAQVRQNEADYRALQSQINPHFIYNTLETARMTAETGDTQTTSEILCALGRQLRYTFSKDTALVTLADEIENVKQYLYIQKLRMDERLVFHIAIDDEARQVLCPRFIIQPLVENAVLHGVEPRSQGGAIWLTVTLQDGRALVEIEDNGVGATEERLEQIRKSLEAGMPEVRDPSRFNGLGMSNVYQRMRHLFQDDFQMTIESAPTGGMHITLSWKGEVRK